MTDTTKVTLSARVHPNALKLAKAASTLQGVTISRFAAKAIEQAARKEILKGSTWEEEHQHQGPRR